MPRVSAKERLEAALNETRMMVLGGQIILSFQFNAIFQPKFSALPTHLKFMNAASIGLLMTALCLLLAPVPYHRLAAGGDATDQMQRFTTGIIAVTPIPFATAIGMDTLIVSNTTLGIGLAAFLTATALGLWYGVELMNRKSAARPTESETKTSLHEKIKTLNTEARIVLPGVQALLGFQFSAFLMESFDRLPAFAKYVHMTGLISLALAAIFLMAPAAYHRIAADGEDRPDVDRFAVVMVLGSLIPLSVGLSADLYLALGIVSDWAPWAAYTSIASAIGTTLFWFGYPLLAKQRPHTSILQH